MQAAVAMAVGVGLAGGALLPVIAYRLAVPAVEPDRTVCGSCGAPIPKGLTGWVRVPARCGACGVRWGPRAWLTALAGGAACGLTAWAVGGNPALPLFVALALLSVLLGAIDLACKRLPHALVVPSIGVGAAGLAVVAMVTGQWSTLVRAGLGAAVLGAVFLLLYLLPGQGLGFGDVKLAVLLGLFLGWLGWREVLLAGLLPWLLNGPVVVVLLLLRRVDRKASLPFGPALLSGSLLAVVISAWLPVFGRL